MESTRQAKIARLIQKELSDILRLQTAKTHGIIISVSAVRVSPDLSIAKAYLSVFPSAKSQEIIENLTANARTIRYELGRRRSRSMSRPVFIQRVPSEATVTSQPNRRSPEARARWQLDASPARSIFTGSVERLNRGG